MFSGGSGASSTGSFASDIDSMSTAAQQLLEEQRDSNEMISKSLVEQTKILKDIRRGSGGGFGLEDLVMAKYATKMLRGLSAGILGGLGLTKLGGVLKGFMAGTKGRIEKVLGAFRLATVGHVTNLFKTVGGMATKVLGMVKSGILKPFEKAMRVIRPLLRTAGSAALLIPKVLSKLLWPITAIFAAVEGYGGWANAEKLLGKDGKNFAGKMTAAIGSIINGLLIGLPNWISDKLGFKNFVSMMNTGRNKIVDFSGKLYRNVKDGILSVGNYVVGTVKDWWKSMPSVGQMVAALPSLANLVIDGLASIGSSIKDTVTGMFDSALDGIKSFAKNPWQTAKDWWKGNPQKTSTIPEVSPVAKGPVSSTSINPVGASIHQHRLEGTITGVTAAALINEVNEENTKDIIEAIEDKNAKGTGTRISISSGGSAGNVGFDGSSGSGWSGPPSMSPGGLAGGHSGGGISTAVRKGGSLSSPHDPSSGTATPAAPAKPAVLPTMDGAPVMKDGKRVEPRRETLADKKNKGTRPVATVPEVSPTSSSSVGADGYSKFTQGVKIGHKRIHMTNPEGRIEERVGGSRSWRNHNPGNIEYGKFARRNGATGTDGRFATFGSYEDGLKAKKKLLWGDSYKDKSIAKAITKYAPRFENDTNGYIKQVARSIGVSPSTTMSDLTPVQRQKMLKAMEKVEGFKKGDTRILREGTRPAPSKGTVTSSARQRHMKRMTEGHFEGDGHNHGPVADIGPRTPMGTPTLPGFKTTGGTRNADGDAIKAMRDTMRGVDPRLQDIVTNGLKDFPLRSKIMSTGAGRRGGNHGRGNAIDFTLFDQNGKALPNYGTGAGQNFRAYELANQKMMKYTQENYPKLADGKGKDFFWGGLFGDYNGRGKKGGYMKSQDGKRGLQLKYGSNDTMHSAFDSANKARAGSIMGGLQGKYKGVYDSGDLLGGSKPYGDGTAYKKDMEALKEYRLPQHEVGKRKLFGVARASGSLPVLGAAKGAKSTSRDFIPIPRGRPTASPSAVPMADGLPTSSPAPSAVPIPPPESAPAQKAAAYQPPPPRQPHDYGNNPNVPAIDEMQMLAINGSALT